MKVTGLGEWARYIEYEEIVRTHKKRAKKEIINQKVKELTSQGIDNEIAKVMAKTFYEYEL